MDPLSPTPGAEPVGSATVRLFPLPQAALFPHSVRALHVYESRYRALVADALAEDRRFALAVLGAGWEADYEGRPNLLPVACLGRIASSAALPDGRYNLMLQGIVRVRIVRELPPARPYREAEVEPLFDVYPPSGPGGLGDVAQSLREAFLRRVTAQGELRERIERALSGEISLGVLTDLLSGWMDLAAELKWKLLAEPRVEVRARTLGELLTSVSRPVRAAAMAGRFPPEFSVN